MAFDFFGAMGALGRLLPGYMQGERQAVQDNWQDLQNYNQTQAGQIQNAFSEATFEPAVQMYGLSLQDAINKSEMAAMQTALQRAGFGPQLQSVVNMGEFMPYVGSAQGAQLLQQSLYPLNMYGQLGQAMNPYMSSYYGGMQPQQMQQMQPQQFYLPTTVRR